MKKSPLEVHGQRFPRTYRKVVRIDGVKTIYEFTPRWSVKSHLGFRTAMLRIETEEAHPEDILNPKHRHGPTTELLIGCIAQQVWSLVQNKA